MGRNKNGLRGYLHSCTYRLCLNTLFGFWTRDASHARLCDLFPSRNCSGATAIVHLANNIFKVALVGRMADMKTVLKFSIPSLIMAIAGALLLNYFANIQPIAEYNLAGKIFTITAVKLVVAILLAIFAILELSPRFEKLGFNPKYIPLGGALSGFFGGLSGQQGALRSAFLIRSGLKKESFIGTAVVSAVVVDISRLIVYGLTFFSKNITVIQNQVGIGLVTAAILTAFFGSFLGSHLVKKITMSTIQIIVGILLFFVSIMLGVGLI